MKRVGLALLYIVFFATLTLFFMYFTFDYMDYFYIGINNGTRAMDIYIIQTPVVIASQIVVVLLFDKFVNRHQRRWRIWLNFAVMIVTVCIVFLAFALDGGGVPREGGFMRFLEYYFFDGVPGRIPSG